MIKIEGADVDYVERLIVRGGINIIRRQCERQKTKPRILAAKTHRS